MDRIIHVCDEVHAFGGVAERTGIQVELKSVKGRKSCCRGLFDFVRKYRLYGDGFYYVPSGQWPQDRPQLDLDDVKRINTATAYEQSRPKAWRERAAQARAEQRET